MFCPDVPKGSFKVTCFWWPRKYNMLKSLLLSFNRQNQTLVCEAFKKCFLKHATAWLNTTNVALGVISDNLLLHFLLVSQRSNPRSSTLTKCCGIGTFNDHSFPRKANVQSACNIVMRDFGGPSTITIVLANVSLVNCQQSWREESAQQHWYHQ